LEKQYNKTYQELENGHYVLVNNPTPNNLFLGNSKGKITYMQFSHSIIYIAVTKC
jgi:hypothetical protein